jgi:hypothetical protein
LGQGLTEQHDDDPRQAQPLRSDGVIAKMLSGMVMRSNL